MKKSFKAMIVEESPKGEFQRSIGEKTIDALPEGEVLIKVHYSSLNYKDALSATGNKGVTKSYPHTPGVDAVGTVETCTKGNFQPGDAVIATGYDLGMNTSGGFAEYIRVPADWVVGLPKELSMKACMSFGTAGLTAAISVYRLQEAGLKPKDGEILVTGATGGVGSLAVAILAKEGYSVVAATGKASEHEFLKSLGASRILDRSEVTDSSKRPLLKGLWAGAIDTVGGEVLTTTIRSTKQTGTVTCCGNVASPNISLTVYPFILRGVRLQGIDAASTPLALREKMWQKLAKDWQFPQLEKMVTEITLDELSEQIDLILQAKIRGRVLVKIA
nr:YhdH/YhfP family quinone oxidoreductase [Chloroherpeton thalassium]